VDLVASISRARFLRGDFARRRQPIRPPWALREDRFIGRCNRCDGCLGACPTRVLVRGAGGFPQLDFSRAECTFCGHCADACRQSAFGPRNGSAPWNWVARVGDGCLAASRVVCRSCGDACEARAIRFRLEAGAAGWPVLDQAACSGCGACVGICPAGAIAMEERTPPVLA
jgi:ferredoxin-type protein NapF